MTVNAGSTSLRLSSFAMGEAPRQIASQHIPHLPEHEGHVFLEFIRSSGIARPKAIVHRVVHGGTSLTRPCLVDTEVEAEIERLAPLAPLHNTVALEWIRVAHEVFGEAVPQVAVFDTAFYAALPATAAAYALPRDLCKRHGIRRYGFHGLAHESMLAQWRQSTGGICDARVISLQLGAGCSITATDGGRPLETSMGFSPLEGLVMATRCGDLDPGVVLYLIDQAGFCIKELESLLNDDAGLRGVSGRSSDMRSLLASDDVNARLAIDMFCHRIRKYLGAYLAVLGGADAILFGGGVGENAHEIRARVLTDFEWAGIRLDKERNAELAPDTGGAIHAGNSTVAIWVISVNEARVMAEAALMLPELRSVAIPAVSSETKQ
jgi:acetate kinase